VNVALLEPAMSKPESGVKRVYQTAKLLQDIVLKANAISLASGGKLTAADYLSTLIESQTTLEKDYAEALRKLAEKRKKS
jgi:hypothetical protein